MTFRSLILPAQKFSEKEKNELLEFEKLILELNRRNIPADVALQINEKIEALNRFEGPSKDYLKKTRSSKKSIFELLQKNLGLVP
ncbi:MAG: hypothetical protein WBL21_05550, partial [Salinimicrobium sp.]